MLNTSSLTHTVTNTIARLFGSASLATDHSAAINAAFQRFAPQHAEWVDSLFDKDFLQRHGTPVIAAYLDGALSRNQTAASLAQRWDRHLGPASIAVRKRRIADITPIAADFLRLLPGATAEPCAESFSVHAARDAQGAVTLALHGKLDRESYQTLLNIAADHLPATSALTIDLSSLEAIALSGVYALHVLAAMASNAEYPTPEAGTAGLRSLAEANFSRGPLPHATIIGASTSICTKLHRTRLHHVYSLTECAQSERPI